MVLERLGISASEEAGYRLLLERPALSTTRIARMLEISSSRLKPLIASLVAKGLLSQAPGGESLWVAIPPSIAVEGLYVRQKDELDRSRSGALEFLRDIAG